MAGERVLVIDDSPTILKVVQLVLSKGGYEVILAVDGEEGIERAKELVPDLVLLDFVMPKLNGYQVCRAFAESELLAKVPVVLMSAKGDQVGERFVKVMGIVDYITKPFSPEAITAVVEHTLTKYKRERGGVTSQYAAAGTEEYDVGDLVDANTNDGDHGENEMTPPSGNLVRGAPGPERHLDPSRTTTPSLMAISGLAPLTLGVLDAEKRAAITRARDEILEALSSGEPELADLLRKRLDDLTLTNIVRHAVRPFIDELDENTALRGSLAQVSIVEILSLLQAQRQSGLLRVWRGSEAQNDATSAEIAWKQGKIEFVMADGFGDAFLLGRFLVEQRCIAATDLDLFLRNRGPSKKPIGQQLVKLGYLTTDDLRRALTRQSAERLYEVLRWPAGKFAFNAARELPPLAIDAALQLDVDGLLMEGVRRIDEWHLIEREIDDFDAVYLRNEEAVQNLGRTRLTRDELAVLELINGKNSVREVIKTSRLGSFDVSKMIYRLLNIRLIRRRIAPVAVS